MWTPDYFVRLADLPAKVEGVTIPNDDGTFDIYINALFFEEKQQEILEHELRHIRRDHFYNDILPIQEIEREANGGPDEVQKLPDVFNHPVGVIPVFNSLEVLRNYMFVMREQVQKEKAAKRR